MVQLETAHEEFIIHLKNSGKASSTVIAYEKDIEQLVDHLQKKGLEQVHEVNTDHLSEFMKKLLDIGLTKKTVSRKTNATKTFFRYLHEKTHIQINVADDLKHPKVETSAPRILSKLEYRALRDTARENERTYALVEILLQTGITISELAHIEIDHIEIHHEGNKGELYVPARDSKHSRRVPLNKAVIEATNEYKEKSRPQIENANHLFITKTGNPMLIRNIRATIDRCFESAGLKDTKVNDLRHTFVAHHLTQGVSLELVSKIVGHKRVSTTEKYLDYIEREIENEKTELGIL